MFDSLHISEFFNRLLSRLENGGSRRHVRTPNHLALTVQAIQHGAVTKLELNQLLSTKYLILWEVFVYPQEMWITVWTSGS
jgi:hypothetical protein